MGTILFRFIGKLTNWGTLCTKPKNSYVFTVLIYILLLKGLKNLKIDDYMYNYGSKYSDLFVEVKKKEQKLGLQLGPQFNYKKDHDLFISLHSQSKFKIILHFNVSENHCKIDQSSIIYPARLLNDSEYGYEFNLKGIKSLYIICYFLKFSFTVGQISDKNAGPIFLR